MARRTRRRGRSERAGGVQQALPALSSLDDLPTLDALHVSEDQRIAFGHVCRTYERAEGADAGELLLGCVVRLDRGFPAVVTETGLVRAEFSAQLTKGAFSQVAVGDWVCVRVPEGHDMALIQAILPRESDIARWRGGARGERQTLAANVDLVLVAQPLGAGIPSCNRIARSTVIARDSGAEAAVVLTKADRVGADEVAAAVASVHEVLGTEMSVVVCCLEADGVASPAADLAVAATAAGARWGTDAVRALVPPGSVAIVLGESGAGKSTLLNGLLGRNALETGAVRVRDDAGRHTTVARRMVQLPGAGVIVDEPGLRSLPLVGHERGLAMVFPEIADAARGCRFRDCTHTHEPGCGVRAAFASGAFGAERLEVYLALAQEMRESAASLDPDVVL